MSPFGFKPPRLTWMYGCGWLWTDGWIWMDVDGWMVYLPVASGVALWAALPPEWEMRHMFSEHLLKKTFIKAHPPLRSSGRGRDRQWLAGCSAGCIADGGCTGCVVACAPLKPDPFLSFGEDGGARDPTPKKRKTKNNSKNKKKKN